MKFKKWIIKVLGMHGIRHQIAEAKFIQSLHEMGLGA